MKCSACGNKMALSTEHSLDRVDPCFRCENCHTNWYSEIVWELITNDFIRRYYGDDKVLKEVPEWTINVDTAEGN